MSPADPRFVNVRAMAWIAVVGCTVVLLFLLLIRDAGVASAERVAAEEAADSASARADREARSRRALERSLLSARDSLEAARAIAAVDSSRADQSASRYWVARAEHSARNDEGAPVTADSLIMLADDALTTCSLARRSCARAQAASDSVIALQDSMIASQAREIDHRKAIEEALRKMQPTFWEVARQVAVEAACGAGGAFGGALVAGDDRAAFGAAIGALAGVVGCAIAVR